MVVIANEDVHSIVFRAVGKNVEMINYSLKASKQRNGFLGSYFVLRVKIKNDYNHIKTHQFFVKTRPSCPILQDFMMDDSNFLEEENFYKELLPRMLEVNHGEKWMPDCLLVNKSVIVLEDLSVRNYVTRSNNLLDEQSLKSALTTLARFHASSVLLEYKLKKSLKEVYPNSFEEKLYSNSTKMGRGIKVGYEAIAMMAERFDFDSSLIPLIYDRVWNLVRGKENAFNVVCHGDLWKNNIMYDENNSFQCLLVDFQLLRYASPFVDVTMLLFVHTTPKERKKFERDMLQHYYSTLQKVVEQSNDKIQIPSFDNLLIDYQERKLIGLTYALLYLPLVYLKSEKVEAIMSDPTVLKSWFLLHRQEIIRSTMDEDPGYENIFKELIIELFEEARRTFETCI